MGTSTEPTSRTCTSVAPTRTAVPGWSRRFCFDVAAYERACLESATTELGRYYVDRGVVDAIRVFAEITDLYGQSYMVSDLNAHG